MNILIYIFIKSQKAEINGLYNQFKTEVKDPYCKFYSTLHTDMTQVKKDYIFDNMNELSRLLALGFLTFSTGYLSRKLLRRSLLSTLKISVVTYFGAGLFLYPEVYNPVFCIQGEKFNENEKEVTNKEVVVQKTLSP